MIDRFSVRYHRAVNDLRLGKTLLAFQRTWRSRRDDRIAGTPFDANRQHLVAIKNSVIEDVPNHIETFTRAAEQRGVIVHRAQAADEAVKCVLDIAANGGVKRVVKSKSMLSEEIDLNSGLERAGLQIVETDLGEWIVQLAGERPSHIVGPALHKNRQQVAELFSAVAGRSLDSEDIRGQVAFAGLSLREEFLAGDMGISGANALIAETGTVVVASNEGNAELVTSLPRIHVVVVGWEKIVPGVEDALSMLELLAPSATGQAATTYVSLITGPTGPDQELHIVLVDNGRSAMQASPLFRDALRCIRCGACANICPSFGAVGGHVFGYIYSGAIGLVNTPFHHGIENAVGPQSLCVSCNACQTVCPVDIPLPQQILDVRAWSARSEGIPLRQRAIMNVWNHRRVFALAARTGRVLQKPFTKDGFVAPPGLARHTRWRRLPALADEPFRDGWQRAIQPPLAGETGKILEEVRIAYFVQCLTDRLYPEMARSVVEVLTSLGATVIFPRAQHCCGLPAIDAGLPDRATHMAKQTIRVLEQTDCDWIVSGATSCVVAMSHDYPHLFRDEPEWQVRALNLGHRMRDFTSFLCEVVKLPDGSLHGKPDGAAYHFFCQSYNVLNFREQPTRVLVNMCGLTSVPLAESNVCCGFGGSVSFERPEISARILKRKLENVEASGASLLVTDNPGCILHLRGGIAAAHLPIQVKHTSEVVAESVRSRRTLPS